MCGCVIPLWGISACPARPSGRGALCALGGGVNPEGVAPPPPVVGMGHLSIILPYLCLHIFQIIP